MPKPNVLVCFPTTRGADKPVFDFVETDATLL